MTQPSSLLIVDSDLHGLETLTYGFEREGRKVTRTSDLSRAVQLSRTSSPALAIVMLREPATAALEVIAALRGAHRAMPILALGDVALKTPGARGRRLRLSVHPDLHPRRRQRRQAGRGHG